MFLRTGVIISDTLAGGAKTHVVIPTRGSDVSGNNRPNG